MKAAKPAPLRLMVDAPGPPGTGHLHMGEPAGTADRIEATSRYLTRDGVPFIPVMGEFHYARTPRADWAEELAAMKAGGITVVATYVFWILHEERRGEFVWGGDRDLRHFIWLCSGLGLDVVVRIGPWGHGEARNGGFPDWVGELAGPVARTDDASYLDLVRPYLAEVAAQLDGLFHHAGGPIVGVQVENELYDQPGHLRTLRRLAEDLGMAPALWTATGWGGAHLPADDVIPVYAGYADAFWESWDTGWPGNASLNFRYSAVRDDLSVGADLRAVTAADDPESTENGAGASAVDGVPDDSRYPYATCELGGGMHVAYHRRPRVDPADVAALALTKLGSGSVWQGYYMFHGGSQVRVASGFTQESHATGYPNDVPQVSYDFRAPLGEYGEVREHFHLLRAQHLFIETVGAHLATMTTHLPRVRPRDTGDTSTLRWAVRSDGVTGFVFVTNHQPAAAPMPDHEGVQFEITMGDRVVVVPTRPVRVPSGAFFVWPVDLPLSATTALRSATAQLMTRVEPGTPGEPALVVLVACDDIPVELVVEGGASIDGPVRVQPLADGIARVTLATVPGPDAVVRLGGPDPVDILVLDPATAARTWVVTLAGTRRLVLTDADVLPQQVGILLRTGAYEIVADIWPSEGLGTLDTVGSDWRVRTTLPAGDPVATRWARLVLSAAPLEPFSAVLEEIVAADPALLAPLRFGPLGRASGPRDGEFASAARYRVVIDPGSFDGAHRLYLEVDWVGDVAQLHLNGALVADQFYGGDPLSVDLMRWRESIDGGVLELWILPWRLDAPIFVDPRARLVAGDQVAAVRETRLRPVRAVTLTAI